MSIRLKRLYNEYNEVVNYFNDHPYIKIKSITGNPPEKYTIDYLIKGLKQSDDGVVLSKEHSVEIILPLEYPTFEPMCRMLTPVFHPNINLNKICIADHWAAGESLVDVICRIGKIISYQNYNIKSPLNGEAAKWAEQNMNRFPIDTADFTIENQTQSELKNNINNEENSNIGELKYETKAEGSCLNCGSNNKNLQFIICEKAGHIICSDCTLECSDCGKHICILCSFDKCSKCNKILCDDCKIYCHACDKTFCKEDECECKRYYPPEARINFKDTVNIVEDKNKIMNDIISSADSEKEEKDSTIYNQDLAKKTCKKCGYIYQESDAAFCEMCGERIIC